MTPVSYLFQAQTDLDEIFCDYEAKSKGLGERFASAFRNSVSLIQSSPLIFGEVAPEIRAATIPKFPFVIYYHSAPDQVVILAVRHGHDDPSIWQTRR